MKKIIKIAMIIIGLTAASYSVADTAKDVTCSVIVTKSSAWDHYHVVIKFIDFNSKQTIAIYDFKPSTKTVPALHKMTQTFDCSQYQTLQFSASYTPIIWSTNKGKIYISKNITSLSDQLLQAKQKIGTKTKDNKTVVSSHIKVKVNFPSGFVDVPKVIEGLTPKIK